MIPLIRDIWSSQNYRRREYNVSCQGLGEKENGKLLFNGYTVSVTQDKKVLEICCTTLSLVNYTVLYTLKFVKNLDLILSALTTNKNSWYMNKINRLIWKNQLWFRAVKKIHKHIFFLQNYESVRKKFSPCEIQRNVTGLSCVDLSVSV